MRTLALLFVTTLIPGCIGELDLGRTRRKISGDANASADPRSARSEPENKRKGIVGADIQFSASVPGGGESKRLKNPGSNGTKGAQEVVLINNDFVRNRQYPVPLLAKYKDGQWKFYFPVKVDHVEYKVGNGTKKIKHEKVSANIKIGSDSGEYFWHAISDDEEFKLESSTAITQVILVCFVESDNSERPPGVQWKDTSKGGYPAEIDELAQKAKSVKVYWDSHMLSSTMSNDASNGPLWSSTLTLKDTFGLTLDDYVSIRRGIAHRHFKPLEHSSHVNDRYIIPETVLNHGPIRVNLDEPKLIIPDTDETFPVPPMKGHG
ncbi:MAG: hypothetical protein AAGF11_42160 [Myxococcota bacterium]